MLIKTIFPVESYLQAERWRMDVNIGVDAKELAERLR